MPEPEEQDQTTQGEIEVYDNRKYELNIAFNNCSIASINIEQYGKPVSTPPPPPGKG